MVLDLREIDYGTESSSKRKIIFVQEVDPVQGKWWENPLEMGAPY